VYKYSGETEIYLPNGDFQKLDKKGNLVYFVDSQLLVEYDLTPKEGI